MKTSVSFILDETGSMGSVKQPTVDGFNEYIRTLQNDESAKDVRFTRTRFNSEKIEVDLADIKLRDVPVLTVEDYQPDAMTPLYDAIGATIVALERQLVGRKKRRVLVVIQTDGQENFSKEWTQEKIFAKIQEKKGDDWTFVFLGADQDAWLAGQQLGLDEGNVLGYDGAKTSETFSRVASATTGYLGSKRSMTKSFFEDADK